MTATRRPGIILADLGNTADAAAVFERGVQQFPGYSDVRTNLAYMLAEDDCVSALHVRKRETQPPCRVV